MFTSNIKQGGLGQKAYDPIGRKEEDEEEEELEMQSIPKGTATFDYGEEFDFKTIRNLIAQEKSETKTPKSHGSKYSDKTAHLFHHKKEPVSHKQEQASLLEKIKDTKSLIELFETYELKTKEMNINEIKDSSKTKIKRYKDCVYFGEIINSKRHGKGFFYCYLFINVYIRNNALWRWKDL